MIEKNCENILAARDYITKLKEKPYTTIERKYEVAADRRPYYITELFQYKASRESFEGTIECRIPETGKSCFFGSGDLDIKLDTSTNKLHATFESVYVNSRVEGKGVGTQTMLAAISFVKAAKDYYSVSEPVRLSGWLSQADRNLGNWERSVPFYHRVGEVAGVERYFEVQGSSEIYATPEEFLANVGNNHGSIVYMV